MAAPAVAALAAAALALAAALAPAPARAGAWTRPPGEGMALVTFDRYRTETVYGAGGAREGIAGDGAFEKRSAHVYLEAGVLPRVTVTGNFFLDALRFTKVDRQPDPLLREPLDRRQRLSNSGFSDQEVGVRYGLFEAPVVLSVAALAHFPALYDDDEMVTPEIEGAGECPPRVCAPARFPLGNGDWGTEARLAAGRSFGAGWSEGFVNAEVGYNRRWMGFRDQLRGEASAGYKGVPRAEIAVGWSGVRTLGDPPAAAPGEPNPLAIAHFTLHRLDVSAAARLVGRLYLHGAAFSHVAGRNVGAGGGFSLGARAEW